MKKIKISICYLLFIICASNAFAQTYVPFNYSPKFIGSEIVTGSLAVGQTTGADNSAIGEFESTTKGFLVPRMTQAQRDAIASPATGLLIYQTDGTAGFYYYTGATWATVGVSTPVSAANGGTGISSYAIGDIIYASGATTLSKLPIGTASQQLRVNAGATALEYFTPAASGITVGTTTITSGTDKRVPYNNSGVYGELANFTMGAVASGFLDVPTGYALAGHQLIKEVNTSSLVIGNTSAASMTGNTNTVLGYGSGAITNGTNNTIVGYGNCTNSANNAASYNTVLGNGCDLRSSTGYITAIGYNAGSLHSGYYSIHIGLSAGSAGGATVGNINIGAYAGEYTNYSSSICIGANAKATATNQLILGGSNSHGVDGTITAIYLGNGVTLTSPSSVTLNATGGSGTNNAGASLTKAAGKGTGTAAGGNNVEQTSVKTSSGTTLQALTDRHNIVGKYVDITAGSAQTFGNLALGTSSTVSGGTVIYTIEANDATDYQSLSGVLKYDVVNKAGTLTVAFEDDQNSACACSAGTLTATVTATTSGTNLLFQADAASSLSETTLRVSFQVLNNFGPAIITPN